MALTAGLLALPLAPAVAAIEPITGGAPASSGQLTFTVLECSDHGSSFTGTACATAGYSVDGLTPALTLQGNPSGSFQTKSFAFSPTGVGVGGYVDTFLRIGVTANPGFLISTISLRANGSTAGAAAASSGVVLKDAGGHTIPTGSMVAAVGSSILDVDIADQQSLTLEIDNKIAKLAKPAGSGTIDSVVFSFNVVAAPEPASMAVLGVGLLGLAGLRRRKTV